MKKKSFVVAVCLMAFVVSSASLHAANKGAAKNMVKKAVKFYNKKGKTKTLEAIKKRDGKFHRGSLYVFTYDSKGVVTAHPTNHGLIGRNVYKLKDSDGFKFVKAIVDGANSKGKGWVKYKWTNPVTEKIGKKHAYFKKVGDVIFVCGVYE